MLFSDCITKDTPPPFNLPSTTFGYTPPEYRVHFTPTSSSWLNQVERFFAEITEKRIRRGVFRSVAALERAILEYLEEHNKNPRPFAWTADADLILNRVKKVIERVSDSGH